MDELESKSNNEILFDIKQMEADYEAVKIKIGKELDKMEAIEKRYAKATQILHDRLKASI